jgi:hypothetical protein
VCQLSGWTPNTPKGALALYLSHMKNNTTQTTLFRQGWKAEVYFGSELNAHHMNTRSVYSFKENGNVSIIHDAPFVNDEAKDRFTVNIRTEHNPRHSTTSPVQSFDNWLDAYYCGVQVINNLNLDSLIAN